MEMIPARRCIDIGIIVKDIEQSLFFYQDVLGLEKIEEVDLPFGRMHRLKFGESFVKLVDPEYAPESGMHGLVGVTGFRYFTFPVTNLNEIYARCEEAGIKAYLPRQEIMPGVLVAILEDPEGNLVELAERR